MVSKKITIFIVLVVVFFIGGVLFPPIFQEIGIFINALCNEWTLWVYLGIFLLLNIGGPVYGTGYSLLRRKYLAGTLLWMFGALVLLAFVLIAISYTALVLIFNTSLDGTLKLILLIMFALIATPYVVLTLEKWLDLSTYFKDIWAHRDDYRKLTFTTEEQGKLVYIHLEKNDSNVSNIFEPAATLKIQEIFLKIRKNPDESLALYVKSAMLLLVTEIVRLFTAWPRTKNRVLHKFAKVKIGKNVCIAQFTRIDPLFPDLIEFEDGSGCGIGCNFLTHNFMQQDPLSICIGPITVGKNARIGAYSLILPGVTIGEGALIGAGSVVTCDVPPYTIAMGVPAKVVKELDPWSEDICSNEGNDNSP